jgi:hypothetical protein
MDSNRKLGLSEQVFDFVNSELETWMAHAKRWYEIDLDTCIKTLLSLSRQKMVRCSARPVPKTDLSLQSLSMNQILVRKSIKWVCIR